ncbi:hypothetical protein [Empedobacter falsenii]|uniref:hypothetical protein n=1 Tax=Empedobacter falsenii TaxID=343874 RepID=UPI001C8D5327|nr:hypothetical protein [Empedobacter falsenii]MBY0066799.1 hypothetical protein [Empedobacter falsenii]
MKKIIQSIIDSIKTRKLLKQQYLNIKVLSNEKDFHQNLDTYNMILIFNKKSSNWSLERINNKFNFLLELGTPPIDLYMKFIIQYVSLNQKHYLEIKKFCESLNKLGKAYSDAYKIFDNIKLIKNSKSNLS